MKAVKKKNSIRRKMVINNLIIIILVIISIEIALTVILANSLIQDNRKNNYELVQTMSNSFDDMWKSFKWAIDNITMNEDFQFVLSRENGIVYENGEDKAVLRVVVSDVSLYCSEMDKVYIFDKDKVQKAWMNRIQSSDWYNYIPALKEEWFDANGKVTTHILDGQLVFSRIIYDKKSLQNIGYILCVYNQSALEKRINTVVPSKKRFVMVVDQNGDIVTHNYPNETILQTMLTTLNGGAEDETGIFRVPNMGTVLVAKHFSNITGWSTVSVIALKDVLSAYTGTFLIIAVVGVFAVILCFFVQSSLAGRIIRPLDEIVKSIMQAKSGNYSDFVNVDAEDEIAILAETYNNLIERTDILVNQLLKGELAYRDAQLAALQSQINPHLLFNTFECINWLSEYGRKDDIRAVIMAFSKLMQAMLSDERMVSMKQELELTENFLRIYKILLGDKFMYSVKSDEVAQEMTIPKLTIQPLVENAVIHGIKPEGGGHVDVVVAVASDGVAISIIDDGIGMPQDRVDAINSYACMKETAPKKVTGIGFCNVIDRLHLIFGEQAKVEVSSSQQWGTLVRIVLPDDIESESLHSSAEKEDYEYLWKEKL